MRLEYKGLLFVALLASSYSRSFSYSAGLTVPDSVRGGLILQAAEGERRVRRPPPSNAAALGSPFTIKVDRQNGGSLDFFMGYEDIPPGRAIPRHYHPHVDEILFVHRGSGVAMLGSREATVTAGATLYIPPGTRGSLKNTGPEPLTNGF